MALRHPQGWVTGDKKGRGAGTAVPPLQFFALLALSELDQRGQSEVPIEDPCASPSLHL